MNKGLIFFLCFLIISLISFASGCREVKMNPTQTPKPLESQTLSLTATPSNTLTPSAPPLVTVETEKGSFKFVMFPNSAPNTVNNFIALARVGFYDGLTFHRVEPDFVVQGGDPNGDGSGGPGYDIKAEFNSRPHLEGTVAMARGEDPDSAGSQFYICLGPQPGLDGKYTVFGQVTEGMDVVKKIAVGDKMLKVTVENAEGYPQPESRPITTQSLREGE